MKNGKIRLLLVSSVFGDRGAERLIIFLYEFLPKNIYEIKILCLRDLAPFAEYLNRTTHIKVDVIGMKNNFDIAALLRFFKYIKDFRPHIANFHHYRAALWGRSATRLLKVPVIIYSVHNKWGGAFHHFLDRIMSRFSDAIVPFSLSVKNYLIQQEKIPLKYIESPIYAGIDVNKFSTFSKSEVNSLRQALGVDDGRNIVGFVGNITLEKGLLFLIEAIRKLKPSYNDICCLMIGEGPDEDLLKEKILEYGLADNFKFLGHRYDVHNIFRIMKIFILPSMREGLPLVIAEAMASSCPVVASHVDGIPEIISHKENGWLVEPGDSDDLANAVRTLLDSDKLREEFIRKGYETVTEKFSIEKMAENYDRLYQRYLGKQS